MPRDGRAYVWDIAQAADAIDSFLSGIDAEAYLADEMTSAAVERKFEIIGEALGQLPKVDPDLAARIPDVRAIGAFRNILIHGYAVIDPGRVYAIARSSLPALRTDAHEILGELSDPAA